MTEHPTPDDDANASPMRQPKPAPAESQKPKDKSNVPSIQAKEEPLRPRKQFDDEDKEFESDHEALEIIEERISTLMHVLDTALDMCIDATEFRRPIYEAEARILWDLLLRLFHVQKGETHSHAYL